MHIISNYYEDHLDFVDYQKSTFIIAGIGQSNAQPILLNSKQDYLEKSKQLQNNALISKSYYSISAEKIYFNSNFDKKLSYFVAPFGVDSFVSKDLLDTLVKNNITGFEIKPTDKLLFEPASQ